MKVSGYVRVSESMSVGDFSAIDKHEDSVDAAINGTKVNSVKSVMTIPDTVFPPTFHHPSLRFKVLSNSRAFNRSGSVSGSGS